MSEWTAIKDKPPEISGRYLVFQAKEPHMHNTAAYSYPHPLCCKPNIAYFRNYGEFYEWVWDSFSIHPCNPTHWMPLPERPKGEQ